MILNDQFLLQIMINDQNLDKIQYHLLFYVKILKLDKFLV